MKQPQSKQFGIAACISLFALSFASAEGGAFDKKLSLQGVTFHVTCPNEGSISHVHIHAKGLTEVSEPIKARVEGIVTGAEVADLNADGSPEIYIYAQSAGSGGYGNVIAYAANHKKSLSQVTLPDLNDDKVASKGYMGHDEFAVVENRLVRRFKLYKAGDTNSKPTGKIRQIPYRLHAGEAGWILRAGPFTDI